MRTLRAAGRSIRQHYGKLLTLALLCVLIGLALSTGARLKYVNSGSMYPTLEMYDLVLTVQTGDYKQNDIIMFRDPEWGITTHRVYEVLPGGYRTIGDANIDPDPDPDYDRRIVSPDRVVGKKVVAVPRVGAWFSPDFWSWKLRQPEFIGGLLFLAAALVCYWVLVYEPRGGRHRGTTNEHESTTVTV